MSMPPGKTTFTLAEAAKLLSCHRETLRRALRNGELRAAKLGRGFRISRVDLERFWTASGGGDLFDNAAEEGPRDDAPQGSRAGAAKGKSGHKQARGNQEQLSLLNSLETEKKSGGEQKDDGASPSANAQG